MGFNGWDGGRGGRREEEGGGRREEEERETKWGKGNKKEGNVHARHVST